MNNFNQDQHTFLEGTFLKKYQINDKNFHPQYLNNNLNADVNSLDNTNDYYISDKASEFAKFSSNNPIEKGSFNNNYINAAEKQQVLSKNEGYYGNINTENLKNNDYYNYNDNNNQRKSTYPTNNGNNKNYIKRNFPYYPNTPNFSYDPSYGPVMTNANSEDFNVNNNINNNPNAFGNSQNYNINQFANVYDTMNRIQANTPYGHNSLGSSFFDDSHLKYFAGFRFKEKEQLQEQEKQKEKDKNKEKEKEKSKKQILKEKLRTSLQDKKIRNNPCFNKGYYNKDLNFTGSGNYTNCYEFIEKYILTEEANRYSSKLKKQNKDLQSAQDTKYPQGLNLTKNNPKRISKHLNSSSTLAQSDKSIYLDNQFKNFKFLFYEKDDTDSLVFNERMPLGLLKEKVKDICEKQYSRILADFTKYNIK